MNGYWILDTDGTVADVVATYPMALNRADYLTRTTHRLHTVAAVKVMEVVR